jgi:DNA repair protein RecO (recombination protein O)
MRLSYATPAIVLRTWPFGESDKIVSFLTENHGKVTGIAKGAKNSRRRFCNSLEPFSLVNLRFQDRTHSNLAFILAAELMLGFRYLVTSLEKISCASYLVEITDGLIGERDESSLVFHHLRDGLKSIEMDGPSLTFLTVFELKLLRLAGYQPLLDGCKRCSRDCYDRSVTRWYFSLRDGGILCESCSKLRREIILISIATLRALIALQDQENPPLPALALPPAVIREIRPVLFRFIQFHMDREIKSAALLRQFSAV